MKSKASKQLSERPYLKMTITFASFNKWPFRSIIPEAIVSTPLRSQYIGYLMRISKYKIRIQTDVAKIK